MLSFGNMIRKNLEISALYFISATIIVTLSIQFYWNYKNYQDIKQRVLNEIQIALDNSLDNYFIQQITQEQAGEKYQLGEVDNLVIIKKDTLQKSTESSAKAIIRTAPTFQTATISIDYKSNNRDSLCLDNLFSYISRSDTFDFRVFNKTFAQELDRKKLAITYGLLFTTENNKILKYNSHLDFEHSTFAKETIFSPETQLKLLFSNPVLIILRQGILGILLSLILAASIIACLLYLLHIINRQKSIVAIKNDLISNITHEFKTPIATISVALEAIVDFNDKNDTEKTKKYLGVSRQQLIKLTAMVEKILETARLDSDELSIQKETIEIKNILADIIQKQQLTTSDKKIIFNSHAGSIQLMADPFHIENAISNIIDNAVKYGGDEITVSLVQSNTSVNIRISDNGTPISKEHRDKIFEKFYRIPKGNKHDIKGFGIGLFYAKNIIGKHGGKIELLPHSKNTTFSIQLPI